MNFKTVLLTHNYSGNEIKEGGMGRTCGIYWREERCIDDFGRETRRKLLGSPSRRREDNIKTDFKEIR